MSVQCIIWISAELCRMIEPDFYSAAEFLHASQLEGSFGTEKPLFFVTLSYSQETIELFQKVLAKPELLFR